MSHYDTIILGQGLAGTTLAWALRSVGVRALVVDRDEAVTSSRIAAGLITPITGQRLAMSWRFDELWPVAIAFYRHLETVTETSFFRTGPMVRLILHAEEQLKFVKKQDAAFRRLIAHPVPLVNADWFADPYGGFEMAPSARLDVAAYLDASWRYFQIQGLYRKDSVQIPDDIALSTDGVTIPRLGVAATRLVFCQGFSGVNNQWFSNVRFGAVKGEILTLRIPELNEPRTINRHGTWLTPLGNGLFRAGATYDRTNLDQVPTTAGREAILTQISQFVRLPVEVIAHDAAVRPIVPSNRPVIGIHAKYPQLAYFNGLGSKGSLSAPFFAMQLANHLASGTAIEREVDLQELPPFAV